MHRATHPNWHCEIEFASARITSTFIHMLVWFTFAAGVAQANEPNICFQSKQIVGQFYIRVIVDTLIDLCVATILHRVFALPTGNAAHVNMLRKPWQTVDWACVACPVQ